MRSVSRFGDWPSHVAIGLLLLGTAWIRGSRKWSRVFLAMLIAMALAGGAEQVIKRTIPRARPSVHADTRWGGPRFSTQISLVSIRTCRRFDRVLWRSNYRTSTHRASVSADPDSDRIFTDVYRCALPIRRCLRGGLGNVLCANCRAPAIAGGTSNIDVAEGVRFELTRPFGLPVFKTGAINRSATPPGPEVRSANSLLHYSVTPSEITQ